MAREAVGRRLVRHSYANGGKRLRLTQEAFGSFCDAALRTGQTAQGTATRHLVRE